MTSDQRIARLEEIVAHLALDVGHVSMNGRATKRPAVAELIAEQKESGVLSDRG